MVVEVSFLKNVKNSKITNLKNNDAKMKQTNKPTIGAKQEPEKKYVQRSGIVEVIKRDRSSILLILLPFHRNARTPNLRK